MAEAQSHNQHAPAHPRATISARARSLQRVLAPIALALVLGAAIVLAIAWASAIAPWRAGASVYSSGSRAVLGYTVPRGADRGARVWIEAPHLAPIRHNVVESPPTWCAFPPGLHPDAPEASNHVFVVKTAGWPFRCFSGVWASDSGPDGPVLRALILSNPTGRKSLSRSLPICPNWPRLASNILLSASLLLLLRFTLIRARIARRRASHRCAVCGYPLHGLTADHPCPECGARAASCHRPLL